MTLSYGTIETRANGATNAIRPLTHPLDLTEKGAAAMVRAACKSPVCDRPVAARQMCIGHYNRWQSTGDAKLDRPMTIDRVARFWSKVDKTSSGCWLWTGWKNNTGYGGGSNPLTGRQGLAHIIAYTLTYGPVPDGLVLDHFVCSNPPCCNPDHVRPVTQWENTLRGNSPTSVNRAKTHCIRGHEFAGRNLYILTTGNRACRRCHADRERNRMARKRAERRGSS